MPALRERRIQEDFSAGMMRDIAPALMPPTACFDLVNGLLDEDGNPYRRGGTAYKSSAGFGTSGLTWITDVYLRPGRRTVFANSADFGVLAEDDKTPVNLGGAGLALPKQSAVLEDLLFIGGGTIYGGSRKTAPYSTGTVTVETGSQIVKGSGVTWNTLVDAGMLFHIGAERVYVVDSILSPTELLLRDTYQGASGSGKAYSLSPLYTIGADPYEAADYLTVCANRIVMVLGRQIIFTEVNNPHSTTNVHGTVNEHVLPQGVEGTGVMTSGQTCVIFTTAGVWELDGLALDIVDAAGNPQHRLQQLSAEAVLAGAAGLAGSGQRIVVPATDGIYLMDGISVPERISRSVDRLYRQRIASGFHMGKATVFRGHYFLPILDSTARVRDLFVCHLDGAVRHRGQVLFPWMRFSGDGGEITAFAVRSALDPREPVLLGAQAREPSRIVDCSAYFDPDDEHAVDADGSSHDFDLITRDIETGSDTENVVRSLATRYELRGEGTLRPYWSDGSLEAAGAARWDEASWDEFEWAPEEGEALFNAISSNGGPSDGRGIERFRINKRLRFGRFRLATSGAPSFFALRSLEMDVRPSRAVRR